MSTVLVVDDSAIDRHRVGRLLQRAPDLHIDFASNGFEALESIGRGQVDLVVTDLIMPKMDGLELVAKLASDYPLIPVILMTGQGNEQTAVRALKAGAASYVPKRVLASLLLETVGNVLEAAHEEQSEARLMDCMTRSEATFLLRADPSMIPPLVNHLHRTMRMLGICNEADGIRVSVALEEAFNNALYHGNLEIGSELRTSDPATFHKIVAHRCECEPYCQRVVRVEACIERSKAQFVIVDQGPGFDPVEVPDPTDFDNLEKASGRGLLLMRTFMDAVEFNGQGNQVTMIKRGVDGVAGANSVD